MVAKSGPGWQLAPSLVSLVDEIDARWPDRATGSDGTIGDASHRARRSDHNPDEDGDVLALDITRDDDHGPYLPGLWDLLVEREDYRISYLIHAGQVVRSYNIEGRRPDGVWRRLLRWTPEPYFGPDPHDGHLHISVLDTAPGKAAGTWDLPPGDDDMAYTEAQLIAFAKEGCDQSWGLATVFGELTGQATVRQTASNVQAVVNMLGKIMGELRTTRVEVDVDETELAARLIDGGMPRSIAAAVIAAYREAIAT